MESRDAGPAEYFGQQFASGFQGPSQHVPTTMHEYVKGIELDMIPRTAVLQRIESASSVLVQDYHFAVDQGIGWELFIRPGDVKTAG